MEDWDVDAEGNIKVHGLQGYESATAPDAILLRMLYFGPHAQQSGDRLDDLQLYMTPALARKLAEDLIANAGRVEERAAG